VNKFLDTLAGLVLTMPYVALAAALFWVCYLFPPALFVVVPFAAIAWAEHRVKGRK
jgi:hypothetical protein